MAHPSRHPSSTRRRLDLAVHGEQGEAPLRERGGARGVAQAALVLVRLARGLLLEALVAERKTSLLLRKSIADL